MSSIGSSFPLGCRRAGFQKFPFAFAPHFFPLGTPPLSYGLSPLSRRRNDLSPQSYRYLLSTCFPFSNESLSCGRKRPADAELFFQDFAYLLPHPFGVVPLPHVIPTGFVLIVGFAFPPLSSTFRFLFRPIRFSSTTSPTGRPSVFLRPTQGMAIALVKTSACAILNLLISRFPPPPPSYISSSFALVFSRQCTISSYAWRGFLTSVLDLDCLRDSSPHAMIHFEFTLDETLLLCLPPVFIYSQPSF